jgi:CRISPR-associated protein Csa2
MIGGSVRFLTNLESLNGVESVGNLTRHRTAPIVLRTETGDYLVRYVPVISGESIAHAYQMTLAELAHKQGLPVTSKTLQGELLKFNDDDALEGVEPPKGEDDMRRFEVDVMLKDVVADVGGFMYAGNNPVRRSSKFAVGYMIPSLVKSEIPAQLEAQFHVRYVLWSKKGKQGESKQAIYNVEVGSALYTLTFLLDDENVGVPSNPGSSPREGELKAQREKRREIAIRALYTVLTGNFGGKRSRFLPSMELQSAVVTVTDFPFVPEPGHSNDYIRNTSNRVGKAKEVLKGSKATVLAFNREGIGVGNAQVVGSAEELITSLLS